VKKFLASLLVVAMAVALTLSFVILLVGADIRISRIANPVLQGMAVMAELFIGIAGLLGTVFLSTRLAVRIFRKTLPPRV
jgi:TPP-dependent trihydroxycyclohexane-1,2-dione (THcHDO) dehydratase